MKHRLFWWLIPLFLAMPQPMSVGDSRLSP